MFPLSRILRNRILDARIPTLPPYEPFVHWKCPHKNHPLKNDNSISKSTSATISIKVAVSLLAK